MAESSTGTTGTSNSDNSGEKDLCPICLDPLPPETWRGDERARTLCCGALICQECVSSLNGHARTAVQNLRNALERGDLDQTRLDEIDTLISNNRCPMCRTDLPKSEKQRFALVQKNVDQHPEWVWPLYKMGKYYEVGCGCPKDLKKSMSYYQKAGERGDAKSQHEIGNYYNFGKGVAKSTKEATYWYTLASNQGYALSQQALGNIYYSQQKYDEAFRLFLIASEQGLDLAQCDLAFCYENGQGVAPSLEKSIYWNKKAADQGNTTAMTNYAGNIMTRAAMANGGRVDVVGKSAGPEALYWARKALSLGHQDAASLVSQMEGLISDLCANCEITPQTSTQKFSMCSQCKATAYCSKECQIAHWRKGHKWDCVDKNGVKKSRNAAQ